MNKMVNKLNFFSILRLLIGIVLLNEFFSLFDNKFYTSTGFIHRLLFLQTHSYYLFTQKILSLFIEGHNFLPFLVAVILLLSAIFLLLGIFLRITLVMTTIVFLIYFISHIATIGTWVFEFVMPLGFTLLLFMTKTKSLRFCADYSGLNTRLACIINLFMTFATFFVIVVSRNSPHYYFVATLTATTLLLLLSLNLYFSKRLGHNHFIDTLSDERLRSKATIFIGLMLSSQVHMDRLINWFTVSGYKNLINIYQQYSTLLPSLNFLLQGIKNKASIILSIQASTESFLALGLVLLVFRPCISILSALLFLGLSFIEFGVPATFPVKFPVEYTWTWELFLSACVMSIIAIFETKKFCQSKTSLIERTLGRTVFSDFSFNKRFLYTLFLALGVYLIVLLSHNVSKASQIFSIESGLTAFFYLLLFHLLDHIKDKYMNLNKSHYNLPKTT